VGIYFCGILDPAADQACRKFPSLITNAYSWITKRYHQWSLLPAYEKRLEQQNGRPNVNVRVAEENLEEELKSVFD